MCELQSLLEVYAVNTTSGDLDLLQQVFSPLVASLLPCVFAPTVSQFAFSPCGLCSSVCLFAYSGVSQPVCFFTEWPLFVSCLFTMWPLFVSLPFYRVIFFFSSLFTMWSLFVILSFRLVVSVCQFVFSPSGICLFFLSVCLSSHLSVVVSVRQFVFSTRASVCQSVFSQLVLSNVPKWFSSFFWSGFGFENYVLN